jgi:hypothetical protein
MKQKLTKVGGRVLLILLISSLLAIFASAGVMANGGANPVRSLPAMVSPGDTFEVTVTFTSPLADFHGIGLDDSAPGGWTVSVDKVWNDPDADADNTPTPNEAAYIWFGPYASGVTFTAVYEITVPDDAEVGNIYGFSGTLEYYIGESVNSTKEPIGGNYTVLITPSGKSTDSSGNPQNEFTTSETVYASGAYFPAYTYVDIYVVEDREWTDGDPIPADVSGGVETVETDADGNLLVTAVWAPTLVVGEYDLVIDANQNGYYNAGIDAVDDPNHPGFVVTGAPVGGTAYPVNKLAILAPWIALAVVIAGAVIFSVRRRHTQSQA